MNNVGVLVVITGASGAGKDSVMAGVIENPKFKSLNFQRVVTCNDRAPRPGETDGKDYHFISHEKLSEMDKNGLLVEPMTLTGTSYKATPKSEIAKLLKGVDLIWRIDPSRAAEVASHNFFQKYFPKEANNLDSNTIVINVIAPKDVIDRRRQKRDGVNYNPNEYLSRDSQEYPYLRILDKHAVCIENLDGKLDEAVSKVSDKIVEFYEKCKMIK